MVTQKRLVLLPPSASLFSCKHGGSFEMPFYNSGNCQPLDCLTLFIPARGGSDETTTHHDGGRFNGDGG